MLYLLALVFPPLACWCCGRFWLGALALVLDMTCVGWPIAATIAWCTVANHSKRIYGHERTGEGV